MKQLFFLLIFAIVYSADLFGQGTFNCSSHEFFIKQLNASPEFKKNQEQLELETQQFANGSFQAKSQAATYIIPVVFHVVYTTAAGNISDAQIIDQITILNKEFNRQQADTALTPLPFKPLAAPFSVEFRLATIDPNGKCTNGINRIYSTLTNCSVQENDVKSVSYWPSNNYLNIWVTQSMHYSGSTTCDGGGYATFPGGQASLDGINIRGDLIGNIGTAAGNTQWGNFKGRYLIHELGHWFNLRHIWGDALCGNDLVTDTPPAVGSNNNCPTFPHNAFNSCGSNANGEMFTNYMDYTNGPCLNMFTAGQVVRMTAAINSNVSGRNNLWTQSNLNATGTNDPYTYPVACAANPGVLNQGPILACVGDSIKITDYSYGGKISTRLWDFGTQAGASSLTDSIVRVSYSTPGIYSFSLNTSYNNVTKSTTFNNKVHILSDLPNTRYIVPFEDNLEDAFDFSNEWLVLNHDNDAVTWEHNNTTGYSGSGCMSIANYNSMAPTVDEVVTPAYDLRSVESPSMTFRLNYSARASHNKDELQVFISSNCGKTWQQAYVKISSGSLKTVSGFQTVTSYTPASGGDDWRLEKVTIAPQHTNNIVRFRFSFKSGGGNNIFIDDINIDGRNTTGLYKLYKTSGIQCYPNPAGNYLVINITNPAAKDMVMEITDLPGKTVAVFNLARQGKTRDGLKLDISHLEPGVYVVRVKENGTSVYSQKLIVEREN